MKMLRKKLFRKYLYYLVSRYYFKSVLKTSPISSYKNAKAEVHSLLCHKDLYLYLYSIKSFIQNTSDCSIIVHDDGSLTSKDKSILNTHIENVKIYGYKEANEIVNCKVDAYKNIRKLRETYPLLKKLTDFHLLSKTKKIISLDSDILFLRKSNDIIKWIQSTKKYAMLSDESPVFSHQDKFLINTHFKYIKNLNSGLMCYHKDMIDLPLAEKCFSLKGFITTYRPNGVGDQQFMAVNFGEVQYKNNISVKRLSALKYVHNKKIWKKAVIAKHYWSAKGSLRSLLVYCKDKIKVDEILK